MFHKHRQERYKYKYRHLSIGGVEHVRGIGGLPLVDAFSVVGQDYIARGIRLTAIEVIAVECVEHVRGIGGLPIVDAFSIEGQDYIARIG